MSARLRLTQAAAGARILGMGSVQPDNVVTNDDLAERVDTNDQWIRDRVGIQERRIADSRDEAGRHGRGRGRAGRQGRRAHT